MRFFAIRHGETDYNHNKRVMGSRVDLPLNESGVKQVKSLIPSLKKHNLEMIYPSPLLRTRETAEIINAELKLPIEYRDELRERDVGELSGKTYDEVEETIGPGKYDGNDYDFRPFGGESAEDVRQRVHKFLEYIAEKHKDHNDSGKELLIVTHAGIINLLYSHFDKPVKQGIRNVCVHSF